MRSSCWVMAVFLCFCAVKAHAAEHKIRLPVVHYAEGLPPRIVGYAGMDGQMRIAAMDIDGWMRENLNDRAYNGFREMTDAKGLITVSGASGVGIFYNAEDATLMLRPDPAILRTRRLSVRSPDVSPVDAALPPAKVSSFANIRVGQDYLHEGTGKTGRMPVRVDFDTAMNVRGWVIENRGDYLEDAGRPFQRAETRLVHDMPGKMVRIAAGDLSYPVSFFQSYQPMLGVSVARNFSLQPYRVTTPTGETSFIVRSPSRVDVLVNGQRIRTLRLDPGSYDVADFPVADGSNDVTLVITDATGNIETKTFPLLSDQSLLQKGLHEYAYNAGIASENSNRQVEYDGENPVISLFHRYGITDTLTAGISAQADGNIRQAGASALAAFAFGTIGLETALSHADAGGIDGAARISFRRSNIEKQRDFTAQVVWRGVDFAAVGQDVPFNAASAEMAARYNQRILGGINMGIGGRYRFAREGAEDDWSYNASASKSFPGGITAALTAEHRSGEGAGIFASLIWTPPLSRHSITAAADTFANRQETRWQYRADRDVGAFSGGAGIARDDGGHAVTGDVNYTGYRFQSSLRHDITSYEDDRRDRRTSFLFGTALVYADGEMALSRPVTNSFVILPRHGNLSVPVGVNASELQNGKSAWQAEADGWGPAVLPDATPYMRRPVRVDTRRLPPGYDIGRDTFSILPSYKSGTVVTIGNAANIYADGILMSPDGSPAALQGGLLRALADAKAAPQEFFTNAQGRFRISRLAPGDYEMTLHGAESVAILSVPDSSAGRFDAGVIVMKEASDDGKL